MVFAVDNDPSIHYTVWIDGADGIIVSASPLKSVFLRRRHQPDAELQYRRYGHRRTPDRLSEYPYLVELHGRIQSEYEYLPVGTGRKLEQPRG